VSAVAPVVRQALARGIASIRARRDRWSMVLS